MKKKRTFSVVLSFLLMVTMMMPSMSAFADTASTEPTGENKEQNITIKMNGDGEITFKDISEKVSDEAKKLLTDAKLPNKDTDGKDVMELNFTYPEGESVTLVMKSSQPGNVTIKQDDKDQTVELKESKEEDKASYTGEYKVTAGNKKEIEVTFTGTEEAKPEVQTLSPVSQDLPKAKISTQATSKKVATQSAPTVSDKYKPTSLPKQGSGNATLHYRKLNNGYFSGEPRCEFKITSGPLKGKTFHGGKSVTMYGHHYKNGKYVYAECIDTNMVPGGNVGQGYTYKMNCIKSTGTRKYYSITFSPKNKVHGHKVQRYRTPKAVWVAYNPSTSIQIKKAIAAKNCNDTYKNNSMYSVSGTQYTLYADKACKKKVVVLTIHSNGKSDTVELKRGTYYAKETRAGKNMTTIDASGSNRKKTAIKINATGKSKIVNTTDYPKLDPLLIQIEKKDKRPGDKRKYSLKGAVFSVKYYGDSSRKTLKNEWKFKTTDDSGIITLNTQKVRQHYISGTLMKDYNGNIGFPTGYYTIKEVTPPDGFRKDPKSYDITLDGGKRNSVTSPNELIINEYQARGNVKFQKVGETYSIDENENVTASQNPLANCKFTLTYNKGKSNEESHTIWTDENGKFDSSKLKNTNNTNCGEPGDGIFFGESEDEISDSLGALPEGDYVLTEERCDANDGFDLISPVSFTVTKDMTTVDLGKLVDPKPDFKTTLTGEKGEKLLYGKGEITLKDTVEYENLDTTKEYEIQGTLMDKSTGKKALDKDGNEIKSEKVTFTPDKPDGTVEVTFKFDGTGVVIGKELVAFEYMRKDGELFGVHASLDDVSQTVGFPDIKTKAAATSTGINIVPGADKVELTDTVSYKGLIAGKTYKAKVWAVDKDGKAIKGTESEREITADSETGSYDMPITLENPTDYAGKDIVLYEELYYDGKLIADHKDASDKDQTIHISKLKTRAVNKDSGMNILADGEQTITDTVDYENLVPGQKYTGKAWLVDESGNKIDGTETTQEFTPNEKNGSFQMNIKFDAGKKSSETADSGEDVDADDEDDSKVDVTDPDDGSDEDTDDSEDKEAADYTDGNVTVFEEVYLNDSLVGEHKDVNDSDQTLYRPEIHTTATGKDSGMHVVPGTGEQFIRDDIEYTGLQKGKEHTVKTWLVDTDGEMIEGTLKESTFTPEETKGVYTVDIPFDASKVSGENVVVFEEVYLNGELMGEHKDLTDEKQTVQVSQVQTQATSSNLYNHNVPADGVQKVEDVVSYENLPAGEKLTVKTWAVDKETGKAASKVETKEFTPEIEEDDTADDDVIADADSDKSEDEDQAGSESGDQEDVAEDEDTDDVEDADDVTEDNDNEDADSDSSKDEDTTSLIQRTSGTITTFCKINTDNYRGKSIVIFEEILNKDGKVIGEHKDVNDGLQTLAIPDLGTKASVKGLLKNTLKPSGNQEVTDTVSYKNLLPERYIVKTYLVDKKTGKRVSEVKESRINIGNLNGTGGGEDGNSTLSGTFTIKGIKVDASKLANHDLVVFEELRLVAQGNSGKSMLVAEHKDINDNAQTVHVDKPNTPPLTGDQKKMLGYILLLVAALVAGSGYYIKKRKDSKTKK